MAIASGNGSGMARAVCLVGMAALPAMTAALPVLVFSGLALLQPELVSDEWDLDTSTRPQPHLWFFLCHAAITGPLWIPAQILIQSAAAWVAVGVLRRRGPSQTVSTLWWGSVGVLLCGAVLYPLGSALAGASVFVAYLTVIVYALAPPRRTEPSEVGPTDVEAAIGGDVKARADRR
jgi:hypothetical protein